MKMSSSAGFDSKLYHHHSGRRAAFKLERRQADLMTMCRWRLLYHTEKYYSKNSYLSPEEMPVNKNPVGSTVFHANFIASVADTARIFYLK